MSTVDATKEKADQIQEYMAQCNGCDNYYKHWMSRELVYTDGVKFVAEVGGAYWLIDAIFSHVVTKRLVRKSEGFMVWTLKRFKNSETMPNGAMLVCTDGGKGGNKPVKLASQRIEYTDFPLDEITLYVENNVLCLPAER